MAVSTKAKSAIAKTSSVSVRPSNVKKEEGEKRGNKQKIRVKLKAYDHRVIDQSAQQIVETVLRTGALVVGPVPLPTSKSRYTVIRSPHVDKRSMEHFEMQTHKRLIDIIDPSTKTIDALMHLNLPVGVGIEIKM